MNRLIAAASAVLATQLALAAGPDDPAYRVRVATDQPAELLAELGEMGFDTECDASIGRNSIELILSETGLAELRRRGLEPVILETARPLRDVLGVGDPENPLAYLLYPDIVSWMNQVAAANPAIAQVVDLNAMFGTPLTHEGRRLYAMRISDNVQTNEDEPAFLLVSCHHAREIVTPVLAMDAIERLTSGYGTDPRITAAVDNNEIWIIPVANPDGYEYVWSTVNLWRKNRRNNGNGTFGVDQNRNYPQGWTASCSGSTNSGSDIYKGPSAGSEPETQTLMQLSLDRRFAKVLDYHSSGRETLFGYRCSSHPFTSFYASEAQALSSASGYGGATRPPSAEGEQYQWQFARFGSLAHLTETATQFQPPFSAAQLEAQMVWPGVLHFLERPISVIGTVTDAVTGLPVEADLSLLGVSFLNGESNTSGGPLGRYQWILPPGNYTLEVAAAGYQTQQFPLSVTSASERRLNIQLVSEALVLSLVNGPSGLIEPGIQPVVEVDITPASQQIVPGSENVFFRDSGGAFSPIALTPAGGGRYTASLPTTACGTTPEYYVQAMGDGGATMRLPAGAPAVVFSYDIGTLTVSFHDNFQTNTGWTAVNLGATTGDWERGVPVNDPNWAYDPISDSDGSGSCLLTQNQLGNTDVDDGAVRITSPNCFNWCPSVPPGWKTANCCGVKFFRRLTTSANASPTANMAVVLVVGAKPCGPASSSRPNWMTKSAADPSVLFACAVTATIGIPIRCTLGKIPSSSPVSPLLDSARRTSSSCRQPRSP
ncbi:MAG: carboxypeptidase regulatory-like domain-containing protein [Planctomycetes bacterium]|nr:carboxypeptidase regulatory-like domain-containing protein [Planctomycetota bacterium]